MAILLDVILPVFGLMLIGYLASAVRVIDEAAVQGLSRFVFTFAIPVLLFRSMARTQLPASVDWGFLLSYYLAAFAMFAGGMAAAAAFRRPAGELGIFGLAASYSNAVLLGVPLILTTFGEAATLPLFLLLALHSALLFTAVTLTMEATRHRLGGLRRLPLATLRGLATNPILLGLMAGLVVNLTGIGIARPVDAIAETLGQAAAPCAVFALGASLARYRISGDLVLASTLCLLKTVVHPIAVWLLATRVFGISPDWAAVAIVMAALPVGVNVYVFAERYQTAVGTVATAIVLSTAASLATVFVLLSTLDPGTP